MRESGKVSTNYAKPRGKCVKDLFGQFFVGPLPRVRPRNGILALLVLVVLVVPLRSEFIGEL